MILLCKTLFIFSCYYELANRWDLFKLSYDRKLFVSLFSLETFLKPSVGLVKLNKLVLIWKILPSYCADSNWIHRLIDFNLCSGPITRWTPVCWSCVDCCFWLPLNYNIGRVEIFSILIIQRNLRYILKKSVCQFIIWCYEFWKRWTLCVIYLEMLSSVLCSIFSGISCLVHQSLLSTNTGIRWPPRFYINLFLANDSRNSTLTCIEAKTGVAVATRQRFVC